MPFVRGSPATPAAPVIVLTKRPRNRPRIFSFHSLDARPSSTVTRLLLIDMCIYIYMFTLDTDSLKTLGFNPRTPTLRLRPMTSWPFKYLPRRSLCLPPALLSSSFSSRSCFPARFARDREPRWNFSVNYAGGNAGPVSRGPVVHMHRIQHCSPTRVLVYKHGRRETQFRAGGIRFFK